MTRHGIQELVGGGVGGIPFEPFPPNDGLLGSEILFL